MPYDARAVANYFLDLAGRSGTPIDPIKLQKLVYFAHGWDLALRGQPLIDEQVEARPYGPVIPSLFHEFKRFGDGPITYPAIVVDDSDEDRPVRIICPTIGDGPEAQSTKQLLERIWEVYGGYSTTQLSNFSHEDGTPWDQVWKEYHGELPRGTDIPSAAIRQYFLRLAVQERESKAAAS